MGHENCYSNHWVEKDFSKDKGNSYTKIEHFIILKSKHLLYFDYTKHSLKSKELRWRLGNMFVTCVNT